MGTKPKTSKLCTICHKPSIPGLLCGKCQYHYNVGQFGKDWADKCLAKTNESVKENQNANDR